MAPTILFYMFVAIRWKYSTKYDFFVFCICRKFTFHICSGVEYLHLKGIIHRDIKGANVLVTDAGIAKLSDFGCSKRLLGMCTNSLEESLKVIKGSVPWMAPEVIKQSGFGRSSDIWSVGATMIEMGMLLQCWSCLWWCGCSQCSLAFTFVLFLSLAL